MKFHSSATRGLCITAMKMGNSKMMMMMMMMSVHNR